MTITVWRIEHGSLPGITALYRLLEAFIELPAHESPVNKSVLSILFYSTSPLFLLLGLQTSRSGMANQFESEFGRPTPLNCRHTSM